MATFRPYPRLVTACLCLVLCFVGVGWRLVQLQVVEHGRLKEEAAEDQVKVNVLPSRRGTILDSRGNVLATSLFTKTVVADPTLVKTNQALVARVLAPLLKMPEADLVRLMQPRVRLLSNGERRDVRGVVLKRKVPIDAWEAIESAMVKIKLGADESAMTKRELKRYQDRCAELARSIQCEPVDDQLRVYPNGSLAAHVVGFLGETDRPATNAAGVRARDGVEWSMDSVLKGTPGWRQTERDVKGRELVARRQEDVAARPGMNVVLTLDLGLQAIVESELATAFRKHTPLSVSCVVVRPATGEILALANLPTFDPNRPGRDLPRNRVITDLAEPGSTFKIVVVSAALNEGITRLDEVFDCENGNFRYCGQTLGDVHPYGLLAVRNVIAKSSNIGAAKIGIRLGEARLYDYMRRFGFGETTSVALPGEVRGKVHPTNRWSRISVAWIPMGHEVMVSPLQMVMAMSAIANGGRLMRPTLIDRVEDEHGRVVAKAQPFMVRQVIRPETARLMVEALKGAVTNGTAARARLDAYTVAGKTGTAQKLENGRYSHQKHFASFIGFLPAEDPQLCISVVMDEPQQGSYGGETAAPVFQRIAERAASYLGLPPSVPEAEPAVAADGAGGKGAPVTAMRGRF